MFNVGSSELVLIAVVALLVLGPKRLPELARGLGKFLRELRRQTDEIRGVVEREFYKMDQDVDAPVHSPAPQLQAAPDTVATGSGSTEEPHPGAPQLQATSNTVAAVSTEELPPSPPLLQATSDASLPVAHPESAVPSPVDPTKKPE